MTVPQHPTHHKQGRILFIESDVSVTAKFKTIVQYEEQHSDNINLTANGSEGLAQYQVNSFDVVVVSHTLPDMTGLEVARQLLQQDVNIPIILMVNEGNNRVMAEALVIGIMHFITKDVPGALEEILPSMIDHSVRRGRERKKATDLTTKLERNQKQLADAVKLTKVGFWEWDEVKDCPVYCSPELAHFIGVTQEEYLDRSSLYDSMSKFVHPKDQNRVMWINSVENKTRLDGFEIEYVMISTDGTHRNVLERAKFELGDDGQAIQSFGTVQDITDQKIAENALMRALADAEQANHAKSEFLATMSHEFRTPLNAILGFSEMMRAQYFGPLGSDNYKEYANDIFDSGEHMLALVNDVLDIAAIEAGKRPLIKELLPLDEILNDCLKSVEKAADDGGIHLSLDNTDNLPSLYADRRSVTQIILNLLSNAIKFTTRKGTISVSAKTVNQEIMISVTDTGIGISKAMLSVITEPFVQSEHDPHKAQEGTGLGLSIVKSLIEAHDGYLKIDSVIDKGTTVSVTFPCYEIENDY